MPAVKSFLYGGKIHGDNKFAQRMSGKDEKSAERSGWYDGTEIPVGISDFAQTQENG